MAITRSGNKTMAETSQGEHQPPSSTSSVPPPAPAPAPAPAPPPSSSNLSPPPVPTIDPPPASSSAPSPNANPPQTLEPQPQPQSHPQQRQQQQQQSPIPRPRPPAQSIPGGGGGGGGGVSIGVPANFSHHQNRPPQPPAPFSSFRPPASYVQPFAGVPRPLSAGLESSSSQARPPAPGVQTIGMIGSLSTASQMRASGMIGQNQQRLGQPQVRSITPSANQGLNSQRFPSHVVPRGPSITSPSSQSPAPQSTQSLQQQWMIQGKQMHPTPVPSSSYNRPQMKPQPMQQRPQHPQQLHQVPMPSHQLRQQQHPQLLQKQNSLPNQSQAIPPQHQVQRAIMPTAPKSNVQVVAQLNEDESSNDIISRKRIRELVTQVDHSENLRPEIEDDLLEIADDFIESIVTAACHLAKHRKSTTLEAKDILLHVERHWNMTLPGFSGDEIKCYKKPSTNDIHKERQAMIKKSLGGTNDGGNTKTPTSTAGQASANPKLNATKQPAMGSPKPT